MAGLTRFHSGCIANLTFHYSYFDPQGRFRVRFYWRPRDNQAHILITQTSDDGRTIDWSAALPELRIMREASSLLLIKTERDQDNRLIYNLWARLNFNFHERMVLFYSTFVAMKHQDSREVPPDYIDDSFGLQKTDPGGEVVEFKADLLYNNTRLEFRVWRDVPSNTVRYEVTRPQHSIPLWTAFVTRYVGDADIMCVENKTEIHIDALKPPPYVFGEFAFLRNSSQGYILPFTNEAGMGDIIFFLQAISVSLTCGFRCQKVLQRVGASVPHEAFPGGLRIAGKEFSFQDILYDEDTRNEWFWKLTP
jgi:hypothetical protein